MIVSLSLVLLVPILGAVVLSVLPSARPETHRRVAEITVATAFVASLPLWWMVNVGAGGEAFQLIERPRALSAAGIQYLLGVDGFSALLVMATAAMGCVAALASRLSAAACGRGFWICLLVLEGALFGSFMALDAVLFLLFAESTVVPMYLLVRAGNGTARHHPARRYLACALGGSAATAAAVLALSWLYYSREGVVTFDVTQLRALVMSPAQQSWIFALLFLGVAVKIALVPVHARLAADRTVVPAAAFALTIVTAKVATYTFLRFGLPLLPDAARSFAPYAAVLCVTGILMVAWLAFAERSWTRLAVYAATGHTALTLLALLTLNPTGVTGSLLQQVEHSVTIGALLLAAGMIEARRVIGGEAVGATATMPRLAVIVLLLVLLAAGVPTPGGEWQMLHGALRRGTVWGAAFGGGVVAAVIYLFAAYRRTLSRRVAGVTPAFDLTPRELMMLAPLIGLTLWTTVHPQPFVARVTPTANRVILRVSPEFTAECDTSLTPEIIAATPGGQFLAAAPCGPDGTPLPSPAEPSR